MKKRKIGKGAWYCKDKTTEVSTSELSARPQLLAAETTDGSSSASAQPVPTGSPVTCCPPSPWELMRTLHTSGWKASLPSSPHRGGEVHKENKWGKKNQQGRLPFLRDCHCHCSASTAHSPGAGRTCSHLLPVMPQQLLQSSKWVKTLGNRLTMRGFNSISP